METVLENPSGSALDRPRVLILLGSYLPGRNGGGPVTSIYCLAERLAEKFEFIVMTLNHDFKSNQIYEVPVHTPIRQSKHQIFYIKDDDLRVRSLHKLISDLSPHYIYLNGMFDSKLTLRVLLMRKLGLLSGSTIVLAPRGELNPGALSLGNFKKRSFLLVAKWMGLYRGIRWHATSESEFSLVEKTFGSTANVHVAQNLTRLASEPVHFGGAKGYKEVGTLRVCYVARIHPMKNLRFAIECLRTACESQPIKVRFDVYGPDESGAYANECRELVGGVPPNLDIQFAGFRTHSEIHCVYEESHLFLLPTLGENFGHSISESLNAGCPVLISDQTPWKGLADAGAGWDFSLDEQQKWVEKIIECAQLNEAEHSKMRKRAISYVRARRDDWEILRANEQLFRET